MKKLSILLLLVVTISCTRNFSEVKTLSVSGSVRLVGAANHADVTVSLYPLAEADTVMTNLRQKYPSVAFEPTQSALFDHRRLEAAYRTQTDEEGFFKFSEIPDGKYNLVAERRGFGWRYLHRVDDVAVLPEITLYPEHRLAGLLDAYTVWTAQHHVVIVNDVVVPDGGTLLIDKGAVIRFEGYSKLIVNGQLTIVGTSSEPAWFTTDVLDRQNAGAWKSIEVRGQCFSAFARFEYGDVGIHTRGGQATISQSLFRQMRDRGVLAGNEAVLEVNECAFYACKTGVQVESNSNATIIGNLITNPVGQNVDGAGIVSVTSSSVISDNAVSHCAIGASVEFAGSADILHNYITNCSIGVSVVSLVREKSTVRIAHNTVTDCANVTVNMLDYATPLIEQNNFLQSERGLFFRAYSLKYSSYETIFARNNYFAQSAVEVKRRIVDTRTDAGGVTGSWEIVIEPISTAPFADAYPR